jgi:hypothetical protein
MFKISEKFVDARGTLWESHVTHGNNRTTTMRTKALLLAAALTAAGIASTLAQSNVYSLNVVGYVNVTVPSGFSLIANPLQASDNTISNLFNSSNPQGSTVFTWNGSFFAANKLDEFGGGWDIPSLDLSPGKGFFINNAGAAFTNTFVGEVLQGALTNTPSAGYSVIASKVPQAGFVQDLGLTPVLGDSIYLWNGSFFVAIKLDEFGGGWDTSSSFVVDPVKGPQINVGQSFFYQNPTGGATWVRNFTVP